MTAEPRVSVVIAAFGRPDALAMAIRAALAQTFSSIEVIVVCDECELSANAAGQINDSRVRIEFLSRNTGEQSGPNNVGTLRAKGAYIAFLNQDDLWFPDHLQLLVDWAEGHLADVVFALSLVIPEGWQLKDRSWTQVLGLGPLFYDPVEHLTPASSWLMRRDVLIALGGWRRSLDLIVEPSQELLFKAARQGYRVVQLPEVSILHIASGLKKNSYLRHHDEAEQFDLGKADRAFALEIVARGDNSLAGAEASSLERPPGHPRLQRLLKPYSEGPIVKAALRAASRIGIHPNFIRYRFGRNWVPGSRNRLLRGIRGLDQLVAHPASDRRRLRQSLVAKVCDIDPSDKIDFGHCGAGWRYLYSGWSVGEPTGVWSDGVRAELWLRPTKQADLIRLSGHMYGANGAGQQLSITSDGHELYAGHFLGMEPFQIEFPIPDVTPRRLIRLCFLLPDAACPPDIPADYRRLLGLFLKSMEIVQREVATSALPAQQE